MSGVTKLAPLGDSRPAADLTTNPPHMPDVGGTSGAAVLTPLRASNSAPALQPTDDAAWRAHIPGVAIPIPRAEARGRVVDIERTLGRQAQQLDVQAGRAQWRGARAHRSAIAPRRTLMHV